MRSSLIHSSLIYASLIRSICRQLIWLLTSVLLFGCAQQTAPIAPEQNTHIKIADNTWVHLPLPSQLGYAVTASQLLSVRYQDQHQQQQSNQLPIQLQITQDKVVLAGFSSWGTRLLSLTYQNQDIDTYVMTGLGGVLPQPEQVLFNLMITLWPVEVWQPQLQRIGWQLTETLTDSSLEPSKPNHTPHAKQRTLINDKGQVVADIYYADRQALKGDITFINHALDFTIVIKTLQYQLESNSSAQETH